MTHERAVLRLVATVGRYVDAYHDDNVDAEGKEYARWAMEDALDDLRAINREWTGGRQV